MQPLDEAFILGNKFKLNWDATGDECTHCCVATAMPHTGSIESYYRKLNKTCVKLNGYISLIYSKGAITFHLFLL